MTVFPSENEDLDDKTENAPVAAVAVLWFPGRENSGLGAQENLALSSPHTGQTAPPNIHVRHTGQAPRQVAQISNSQRKLVARRGTCLPTCKRFSPLPPHVQVRPHPDHRNRGFDQDSTSRGKPGGGNGWPPVCALKRTCHLLLSYQDLASTQVERWSRDRGSTNQTLGGLKCPHPTPLCWTVKNFCRLADPRLSCA